MVGMEGDAKGESCFLGSGSPFTEDVAVRTDVLGVPLLVLAIPEVEVVVVVTEREEVLSSNFLIELHELLGIPVLSLEKRKNVLESHFGRMTVVLTMVVGLVGAFHI